MSVAKGQEMVVGWEGFLRLTGRLRDEVSEEAFAKGGKPTRHRRLITRHIY